MSTVLRTPQSTEAPRRRTLSSIKRVFSRYTVGAAAATVVSVGTLSLVYGLHLLSARPASVAGWATGALTNYTLNRWWAWGRRGRPHPVRELLPYWAIVLTTMSVSAWATGVAGEIGARVFETHGPRVVFVSGVFLAVYGLMFVGKFLVLYFFVFADPARDEAKRGQRFRLRRSRHHVPSTTRQ